MHVLFDWLKKFLEKTGDKECFIFQGFFGIWSEAEIRPQSKSKFPLNFPKFAWKISQSKIS